MLLSSLTAAALASATVARTKQDPNVMVMRSNSDTGVMRCKSTPPEALKLANQSSVDSMEGHETMPGIVPGLAVYPSTSTTSLSSVDSQNSQSGGRSRQQLLEDRHQELLRKQKLLQEQYSRLQLLSRGKMPAGFLNELKKTGSESNIMSKSAQNVNNGGSLSQLVNDANRKDTSSGVGVVIVNNNNDMTRAKTLHVNGKKAPAPLPPVNVATNDATPGKQIETQKIYETDIL